MSFSVASFRQRCALSSSVDWRWDRGGLCVGPRTATSCPTQRRRTSTCLPTLLLSSGGHVQLGESLLGSERSIASLLRGGERALIATRLGDLDVVQGLEGVLPYAELRARAIDVEMAGVTIAI